MAQKSTFNNLSDESLSKATGKTWDEWFAVLDAANATKMSHKEIAAWLSDGRIESGWWAQSVTVGYEQACGMRKANQKLDGFTVSVSKMMPVAVSPLYRAWAEPERRAKWLPGSEKLSITTANRDKNVRGRWGERSVLVVSFAAKGEQKTQVVIQHERLDEEADVEAMRSHWKESLGALQEMLTGDGAAR